MSIFKKACVQIRTLSACPNSSELDSFRHTETFLTTLGNAKTSKSFPFFSVMTKHLLKFIENSCEDADFNLKTNFEKDSLTLQI